MRDRAFSERLPAILMLLLVGYRAVSTRLTHASSVIEHSAIVNSLFNAHLESPGAFRSSAYGDTS